MKIVRYVIVQNVKLRKSQGEKIGMDAGLSLRVMKG